MTEDSRAPDAPVEEPADETPEATPDSQADDTAENTQQAQQPNDEVVPAKRYTDLQAAYTRETQARARLEDQLLAERNRQVKPPVDPTDPLAQERAALEAERASIRTENEWAQVRRQHPPELVAAYERAARTWALDPTPAGALAGFIDGISYLAGQANQQQATTGNAQQPQPKGTTRPRVDTSRSDAPDSAAIDKQIAGAKASGNLQKGVAGILARAGFGPGPGS